MNEHETTTCQQCGAQPGQPCTYTAADGTTRISNYTHSSRRNTRTSTPQPPARNTGELARETDPPHTLDTRCRYCNSTNRTLPERWSRNTLLLWECADCARPWYRITPVRA